MIRPVSYSELYTWGICKKRWSYAYEQGLQPIGLMAAPTLGIVGHVALAAFYKGDNWHKALAEYYGIERRRLAEQNRMFSGPNIAALDEAIDIVLDIIPRYIQLWEKQPWEAVEVEMPFDVGPYHGRVDAIVRAEDRNLYVVDNKFTTHFVQPEDLILNLQLGIYHWVAREMGFDIAGVIYNQIKPKKETLPTLSTVLDKRTNRPKSVNKTRIFCSWETYSNFVKANGYDITDYLDMRSKLEEVEFVRRTLVYRSPYEIDKFMEDVNLRIEDILDTDHKVYRNESPSNCRGCSYRELCFGEVKGEDVEQLKLYNFTQRNRELDVEEEEKNETIDTLSAM